MEKKGTCVLNEELWRNVQFHNELNSSSITFLSASVLPLPALSVNAPFFYPEDYGRPTLN